MSTFGVKPARGDPGGSIPVGASENVGSAPIRNPRALSLCLGQRPVWDFERVDQKFAELLVALSFSVQSVPVLFL